MSTVSGIWESIAGVFSSPMTCTERRKKFREYLKNNLADNFEGCNSVDLSRPSALSFDQKSLGLSTCKLLDKKGSVIAVFKFDIRFQSSGKKSVQVVLRKQEGEKYPANLEEVITRLVKESGYLEGYSVSIQA